MYDRKVLFQIQFRVKIHLNQIITSQDLGTLNFKNFQIIFFYEIQFDSKNSSNQQIKKSILLYIYPFFFFLAYTREELLSILARTYPTVNLTTIRRVIRKVHSHAIMYSVFYTARLYILCLWSFFIIVCFISHSVIPGHTFEENSQPQPLGFAVVLI